jgi:hypothetical protein
MLKRLITLLFPILVIFQFVLPKNIYATRDPLSTPNNIYGIHIHDESDLEDAANLVNSNGGDWGYVTIVIQKGERDHNRWQKIFDKMRMLHLIPILRIATAEKDGGWEKGNFNEIPGWVDFLNNLNWVVENRYVVIGNEPNHAIEWGGEVNPEEYSDYLLAFAKALKEKNKDFFILPAALDASAPTNHLHLNPTEFIKRMVKKNPEILDIIDGWNSHSYPNPEFSGSVFDKDSVSIKSYVHEIETLKSLGLKKELPVFITETGWAHNQNKKELRHILISPQEVGKRLTIAFQEVWTEKNIVAITPFIINYQGEPFSKFSWKDPSGSFYFFYFDIQNLKKVKGEPSIITDLSLTAILLPPIFKTNEGKFGYAFAKNTGQSIWIRERSTRSKNGVLFKLIYPQSVPPGHTGLVYFQKKPS